MTMNHLQTKEAISIHLDSWDDMTRIGTTTTDALMDQSNFTELDNHYLHFLKEKKKTKAP